MRSLGQGLFWSSDRYDATKMIMIYMTFFSDTAKHTNLSLGKCDRVSGQSHRLETCYKNGYMCNEEEKNNAVIQLATGLMTFAHLFLKLS
jgi:hypothetical protein